MWLCAMFSDGNVNSENGDGDLACVYVYIGDGVGSLGQNWSRCVFSFGCLFEFP